MRIMLNHLFGSSRRVAAVALAAWLAPIAAAQDVPTASFAGASAGDVLNALHEACYEAGMRVETATGQRIVCTTGLSGDERRRAGVAVGDVHEGRVRHRIRFELAGRDAGVRVWAYPWIEMREPEGVVLEEEIVDEAYLARVQDVLSGIESAPSDGDDSAPRDAWRERYETRRAWQLDAHLRAVDYCDRNLDALTRERVDALLERAGVQPIGRSLRDRCEELYEPVFAWGLARGIDAPSVDAYAEYRASLPPAQRCTGRLALDATC